MKPTRLRNRNKRVLTKNLGTLSNRNVDPVEESPTGLKPDASARDYMSQMDQAHAMQRSGDVQRPPASLMQAIRDSEAERRDRKKTQESAWSTEQTTFLLTPRVNGSVDRSTWSMFVYDSANSGNPIHLRKMLTQHAASLGWDSHDVFAQWTGDIDNSIDNARQQEAAFKDKKDRAPTQYWNAHEQLEKLKTAKEIMTDGDEVMPTMDEARDPMRVISKFLDDKKSSEENRARHGERLRKERDAKLAQDRDQDPFDEGNTSRRRY
jgi:hypothetical protein